MVIWQNNDIEHKNEEDEEFSGAFRADPTQSDTIDVPISKRLENSWSHWLKHGLNIQELELLIGQYTWPEFLNALILNTKIQVLLDIEKLFNVKKRDAYLLKNWTRYYCCCNTINWRYNCWYRVLILRVTSFRNNNTCMVLLQYELYYYEQ